MIEHGAVLLAEALVQRGIRAEPLVMPRVMRVKEPRGQIHEKRAAHRDTPRAKVLEVRNFWSRPNDFYRAWWPVDFSVPGGRSPNQERILIPERSTTYEPNRT